MPTSLVLPANVDPKKYEGDIDILAGPLPPSEPYVAALEEARRRFPNADPSWWPQLAGVPTPAWPPKFDYLAAIG